MESLDKRIADRKKRAKENNEPETSSNFLTNSVGATGKSGDWGSDAKDAKKSGVKDPTA